MEMLRKVSLYRECFLQFQQKNTVRVPVFLLCIKLLWEWNWYT